ncbi:MULTISPECIES: hypothetical protein [unclassified Paenibacillus]|uniref:hypothetical protein n=1 Tax=unclassified Paenibacillus TaxID=185978 RepID=UPI00020D6F1D|nr:MULTISPECIES: hypothetical protein [unclassified Paenibacillus]EGL16995.1 hypothetical protein HMPREF9413_3703 [Paenibacillus sp. HGF7]
MMSKLLCDSVAGKQVCFRQAEGTAAGRKRGSFSAAVYRASLLRLRLYGIAASAGFPAAALLCMLSRKSCYPG